MKIKTFLICWVVSFIVVFGLNGIFHGMLASSFFDNNLSQFTPVIKKMSDTNPVWVGLLDLVLTFGMTCFITFRQQGKISLPQAAFFGGLINLISSGAWNFANAAMFLNWSISLTLVDLCWHIMLGVLGGLIIGTLHNKFESKTI